MQLEVHTMLGRGPGSREQRPPELVSPYYRRDQTEVDPGRSQSFLGGIGSIGHF